MLITLEGIEGSGKTTQIPALSKHLSQTGHEVVITREPGATSIGRRIRSLLLDPGSCGMAPVCELLLYYADRSQHLFEIVMPALKAGKTVLCDRFFDATRVYQGVARGVSMDWIDQLQDLVVQDLEPDLTLLFDLDPETGLGRTHTALESGERMASESRFEREEIRFHRKVRQGYLELAVQEAHRFAVIDASVSPQDVFSQIVHHIDTRLPGRP